MTEKEKQVYESIQKTGFLTELNVVKILGDNGWKTEHSKTYEDLDENKSREIDIVSFKPHYQKTLGFRLHFFLVCEAKKSFSPWVIFTTEVLVAKNKQPDKRWEKYLDE